jgi:hypothetical protein
MQQSKEWQFGVSHLLCTSERVGFCGSYRSQAKGEEHMSREAMKQALEALENAGEAVYARGGIAAVGSLNIAAQALRQALETEREWVGLTDDEVAIICGECAASAHKTDDISYARAIEAKLKEKNA